MKRVWAVASNTFWQSIRMKLALAVIIILLVLLPLMSFTMVGDGTLKGKLQTFSSYGLSLTNLLLCFLTIAISTYTLSSDLKGKQLFSVITKPIRRFEILIGKMLGIIMLNTLLLIIFSAIIYGLTVYMPRYIESSPQEIAKVNDEFFTARRGLKPQINPEDFRKEAEAEYQMLVERGDINEITNEIVLNRQIEQMMLNKAQQARGVAVGGSKTWTFKNVYPKSDSIFIKFKYEVINQPPDRNIWGRWFVGDDRADQGQVVSTQSYDSYDRKDVIKAIHEIKVPASYVAKDGYLAVSFQNLMYNRTTVIPQDVELLYKQDSFTANYIRIFFLLFIRIVYLAILGVSLTTFLSFPVAIFVCLGVLVVALVSSFVTEAIEMLSQGLNVLYFFTIKPVILSIPRFDGDYNPSKLLVASRNLEWTTLLRSLLLTLLRSVFIFIIGIFVFSRREIAKITSS